MTKFTWTNPEGTEHQYRIRWKHFHPDRTDQPGTACRIDFLDRETGEWIKLSEGLAVLYYKDQFNRAIGRKASLAKALQPAIYPSFRKAAWEAFLQ